jgi:hypothetical protein
MNTSRGKDPESAKAKHGPRSEVTWEGGSGRQPYSNQGADEAEAPNSENEFIAEGNRGELSGRNLEQLEKVKTKP